MDSGEEEEGEAEGETPRAEESREMGFKQAVLRLTLVILFPIFAFFFLALLVGFLAILGGEVSIPSPAPSVPSLCRIVSSSVDIRSSKVCELGVLNYKAKNVFHPSERSKFRCRYDYYWASVFQVEYKDHSLGQTKLALAEAPNEALPIDCRPNFGTAWLTKDKFKVNETYDCWYTSGVAKVMLYRDEIFHCQAEDPSLVEMIGRYFILSTKNFQSLFVRKKGKASNWHWETIAGILTGFFTSFISITFIRILHHMRPLLLHIKQNCIVQMLRRGINSVFLKRACFLVAYFSVVGWLTVQYGKRLGLPEIYTTKNY